MVGQQEAAGDPRMRLVCSRAQADEQVGGRGGPTGGVVLAPIQISKSRDRRAMEGLEVPARPSFRLRSGGWDGMVKVLFHGCFPSVDPATLRPR